MLSRNMSNHGRLAPIQHFESCGHCPYVMVGEKGIYYLDTHYCSLGIIHRTARCTVEGT